MGIEGKIGEASRGSIEGKVLKKGRWRNLEKEMKERGEMKGGGASEEAHSPKNRAAHHPRHSHRHFPQVFYTRDAQPTPTFVI
jgi:hypothetical protein